MYVCACLVTFFLSITRWGDDSDFGGYRPDFMGNIAVAGDDD